MKGMAGSYLKVYLLSKETRTIKAYDGTTMQQILDFVITRLRAINKQFFSLQITHTLPNGSKISHWIPSNYTLPDVNQRYPPPDKTGWEWHLKIRFLPKNIQSLAETDVETFNYFYDQIRCEFYECLAEQVEVETAVQLGCLQMRRQYKNLSQEALNKKSNIAMLENEIGFDKFIPKVVLDKAKSKGRIRKLVQQYLKQYSVLTENQCVYKFFEILSKVKQMGSTTFIVRLHEDSEELELQVGPLLGISYKLNDNTSVRIMFDDVQAITVEPTCTYQTRVIVIHKSPPSSEQRLDLFAPSVYTALELASLVDGYCTLSTPNKSTRITSDSEGAPRSIRAKGIHGRTHSMYSANRPSFNGPSSAAEGLQRRSCFEMSGFEGGGGGELGPTFVEEEPDYAQADYDDFCLAPEEVTVLEPIGAGQFGTVFKGFLGSPGEEGRTVAIKTLKEETSTSDRDKFLAEAYTMKKFNHAHIIQVLGVVYVDHKPPWIVMELAGEGELRGYLHTHGPALPTSTLLLFTEQVSSAMLYLASELKVVHRDIAARNVLVFSHSLVKLADFGLSRHIEDEGYYKASKGRLPIKWMAPESINFRRFTSASDVWMFGVCIWELFMLGVKPFRGIKNSEVISMIEAGHRLNLPERMPVTLYSLLDKCWSYEPSERPSFKQILGVVQAIIRDDGSASVLPPAKPPRPAHLGSSSTRDSFRSTSSTAVPEDEGRGELAAGGGPESTTMWLLRQHPGAGETKYSYIPLPPGGAIPKRKIPLDLEIDRTHDEVYKALATMVSKILDVNQIIEKVQSEDFQKLVTQVGNYLKLFIQASNAEYQRISENGKMSIDRSVIDMTQQTLIVDMKEVIDAMKEAMRLSSTTVDQQFRQKLKIRMATLAKDGKSLLEAVDDCRSQSSLYSPNIERMLAQQQPGDNVSVRERCAYSVDFSRMNQSEPPEGLILRRQSAPPTEGTSS